VLNCSQVYVVRNKIKKPSFVRFEVLTAVLLKIQVFRDVRLC
jgi:hypothetical protein